MNTRVFLHDDKRNISGNLFSLEEDCASVLLVAGPLLVDALVASAGGVEIGLEGLEVILLHLLEAENVGVPREDVRDHPGIPQVPLQEVGRDAWNACTRCLSDQQ